MNWPKTTIVIMSKFVNKVCSRICFDQNSENIIKSPNFGKIGPKISGAMLPCSPISPMGVMQQRYGHGLLMWLLRFLRSNYVKI